MSRCRHGRKRWNVHAKVKEMQRPSFLLWRQVYYALIFLSQKLLFLLSSPIGGGKLPWSWLILRWHIGYQVWLFHWIMIKLILNCENCNLRICLPCFLYLFAGWIAKNESWNGCHEKRCRALFTSGNVLVLCFLFFYFYFFTTSISPPLF